MITSIPSTVLSADGAESPVMMLPPGRTASFTLVNGQNANALAKGEVQFLVSHVGRNMFGVPTRYPSYTGSAAGVLYYNDTASVQELKFRLVETDDSDSGLSGQMTVSADTLPTQISVLKDPKTNKDLVTVRDDKVCIEPETIVRIPEFTDNTGALAAGLPIGALWTDGDGAVAAVVPGGGPG